MVLFLFPKDGNSSVISFIDRQDIVFSRRKNALLQDLAVAGNMQSFTVCLFYSNSGNSIGAA